MGQIAAKCSHQYLKNGHSTIVKNHEPMPGEQATAKDGRMLL
jgi:hypothetical protein